MKIVPVAEIKARLSEYVAACHEEAVIITKNGRPTAMLVPVTNEADLERLILTHSPRFREIIRQSRQRFAQMGGISHDEFWARLNAEYDSCPNTKGE